MTRRRMLAGGLYVLSLGLGSLALSIIFLFIPWRESNGVGGVMVPLAIAIPLLAPSFWMLLPLFLGDTPHTAAVLARVWLILGLVPIPIITAGIARDHSPWSVLAILPIVVDGALFHSAFAMRRAAQRELRLAPNQPGQPPDP